MIKAGRKPDRRCGGINNNNTKKEQGKPKRLPCLSNKAKTPNGKQKLGKAKSRPDSRTHSGGECCTFHLHGQIEKAGGKAGGKSRGKAERRSAAVCSYISRSNVFGVTQIRFTCK